MDLIRVLMTSPRLYVHDADREKIVEITSRFGHPETLDALQEFYVKIDKSKKKEAAKAVKQIQRDARMLLVCKTRLRKNAHDLKRQLKCIKDDPKISDGVKADLTKFAATLQQSELARLHKRKLERVKQKKQQETHSKHAESGGPQPPPYLSDWAMEEWNAQNGGNNLRRHPKKIPGMVGGWHEMQFA
jgi:hypothetical protein